MVILGCIAAVTAICGCVKCMRCRLRDCSCVKKLLRVTGYDPFDDFEITLLVHEATFEAQGKKLNTYVNVTSGPNSVKTDTNSNGADHVTHFQQPLHVLVEQGTEQLVLDLMDSHNRVLATLPLDVAEHLLNPANLQTEMLYTMKQKAKGVRNPKLKVTLVVAGKDDEEMGLLAHHEVVAGLDEGVDVLVAQELKKAKDHTHAADGGQISEMDVLKQACAGPLEVFEGLGKTHACYLAILGPPASRRWVLGLWRDEQAYENGKHAMQEVDLLKIRTVSPDPDRHHVFVVNYYDEHKVHKALTFRRIDRARDVWVEILHLLVTKARENREALKTAKRSGSMTPTKSTGKTASGGRGSAIGSFKGPP